MIEDATLAVRVTHTEVLSEGVRSLRLARVDGRPLPHFSAGSHVVVDIDTGERILRNPYSLISDGDRRGEPILDYEIAVALNPRSRGGSAWLHRFARPGARLRIGWPHNLFGPPGPARRHVLIAGGIGITPIFAMARALLDSGSAFELHYAFRGADRAPLLERLRELTIRPGAARTLHE
ncbi:MAG: ferredoxin reductase, partial [Burkholderiaceae bacterium]